MTVLFTTCLSAYLGPYSLWPPQSKVELRSGSGLIASIEIIFKTSSNITAAGVKEKIKGASGIFNGGSFSETNLCTRKACDVTTTNCTPKDGSFNCSCLDDYIKTNYSDRVCIACPSGKEAKNSVECVPCSFGYSGLNCSESWQLVLVIVGSVLGGLLLIALILLPVVALRPSKKNANADIGKPYVSHSPAKAPLVNSNSNFANSQAPSVNGSAYGGAAVPRIPRATTTNPWDNRTDLEMTPSNSRQNLIPGGRNMRPHDDRDDMNPYSQPRPQSNLYPQSRPQNNPYAQNRAQINPYAQSQGQSNPYFTNDDGRRFN
ncbi:mucin-13 [Lates japonicus]|uniref:Mucin-13 n=1 Tax=Lates japonicus TaxID=270547 RepID=A0AAD3MZV8_LATJO|nr:mucin-13 [Lates japonicus]